MKEEEKTIAKRIVRSIEEMELNNLEVVDLVYKLENKSLASIKGDFDKIPMTIILQDGSGLQFDGERLTAYDDTLYSYEPPNHLDQEE